MVASGATALVSSVTDMVGAMGWLLVSVGNGNCERMRAERRQKFPLAESKKDSGEGGCNTTVGGN